MVKPSALERRTDQVMVELDRSRVEHTGCIEKRTLRPILEDDAIPTPHISNECTLTAQVEAEPPAE